MSEHAELPLIQQADFEKIARLATYEIESLASELVNRSKLIDHEEGDMWMESHIIKVLSLRIRDLNSMIMSILSDDNVTVEDLTFKIG